MKVKCINIFLQSKQLISSRVRLLKGLKLIDVSFIISQGASGNHYLTAVV